MKQSLLSPKTGTAALGPKPGSPSCSQQPRRGNRGIFGASLERTNTHLNDLRMGIHPCIGLQHTACTHTHTHTHTHTACTHTHTHTHTACTHTHTHTACTHAHKACMHTHTHTHTLPLTKHSETISKWVIKIGL